MTNKPPILDYAPFQSRSRAVATGCLLRAALPFALMAAGLYAPHPTGIWYFGPRDQWLVAIDTAGLTIGTSTDIVGLGHSTLFFLKCLLIALPAWAIWKLLSRLRRKWSPGEGAQTRTPGRGR